jgi:YfiH family protein
VVGSQEIDRETDPGTIPVAWRRWAGLTAGFGDRFVQPQHPCVRIHQVHGDRVIRADALAPGLHSEVRGDALVVRGGCVAAIATADCVPILLVDPVSRWAAAIHAGWKGTIARVGMAVVAAARRDGVDPAGLYAALGPSIGPCCYEVGDEVAHVFANENLPVVPGREKDRSFIDLRRCNEILLSGAGLLRDRIRICGPCTRCRSDRYHSYRVDRERAGRQLSWIGWVDPARQKDSRGSV